MNFKPHAYKAYTLLIAIIFSFNSSSFAQCLVNQLELSSGINVSVSGSTRTLSTLSAATPDSKWIITAADAIYNAAFTAGMSAVVVTPPGGMGTIPNVGDISISTQWGTTGFQCTTAQEMTLERSFKICETGLFQCDVSFICDNYVSSVTLVETNTLNSTTLYTGTPTNLPANYQSPPITVAPTTLSLGQGDYVLRVILGNYGPNNPILSHNPVSIFIEATITEINGSLAIVDDWNSNCVDYVCSESECSDECYWKVEGNNILNGNNRFGTASSHTVDIITENHLRGVLTPGGDNSTDMTAGRLGWNTMSPTARLHVDCMFGNEDWSGMSDIRFENLEHGEGEVLVISPEGYVFNSGIMLSDISEMTGMIAAQQETIQQLQQKVAALEGVATGISNTSKTDNSSIAQNIPNPFNGQTTISYYVASMSKDAFVAVYDLNGKQLNKFQVQTTGKGEITINGGDMPAGMYLYSLVIDGEIIDSKRMVLSK